MDPLKLERVRDLNLSAASAPGRPAFLSAASGLVRIGDWLYVVADDEHHLGIFSLKSNLPGKLFRIFPGELPLHTKKRKKKKPDLESLTLTPRGLLAIPSGSRSNRTEGRTMSVKPDGLLGKRITSFSFERHFELLSNYFKELNIEGGAWMGDSVFLAQRGTAKNGDNARIEFDLKSFLSSKPVVRSIRWYDLGKLNGVKLGFTDLTSLTDGRFVFTAAAEANENTYEDAPCAGSVVGLLDKNGKLIFQEVISDSMKIEGIHAEIKDRKIKALLVNDEDDSAQVAGLFRISFPDLGQH